MKKSNLKIVKLDKNKSLFNYEKKILIKKIGIFRIKAKSIYLMSKQVLNPERVL